MNLSQRLNAVIDLVSSAYCGADVGCDHGYISIELINRNIAEQMIAMDIRKGPLLRAKEHVLQYGMENKIDTRLSDGVSMLGKKEADFLVIAGMGGNLVIHILEKGHAVIKEMDQCILQPQSEIEKVRKYLRENHYKIVAENIVYEDGKYYPMIKAVPMLLEITESRKVFDCFGELLLKDKHPVLKQYLLYQLEKKEYILNNLKKQELLHVGRIRELEQDKSVILEALDYM